MAVLERVDKSLHSSLYVKEFYYLVGPEKYRMVEESQGLSQSLFQFANSSWLCAVAFFGSVTPDVNRDKSTHGLGPVLLFKTLPFFSLYMYASIHVLLQTKRSSKCPPNLTPELFYFLYLKEIPVPTWYLNSEAIFKVQ